MSIRDALAPLTTHPRSQISPVPGYILANWAIRAFRGCERLHKAVYRHFRGAARWSNLPLATTG